MLRRINTGHWLSHSNYLPFNSTIPQWTSHLPFTHIWWIPKYVSNYNIKIIVNYVRVVAFYLFGSSILLQKLVETPCKFFPWKTQWFHICYLIFVNSQVWPSTTVVWSLPNKNWVILSHFSLVQKEYKDFELVLLRQTCQRNHVLNYSSGNGLGTK